MRGWRPCGEFWVELSEGALAGLNAVAKVLMAVLVFLSFAWLLERVLP